jgi:methionine synthase / methylenetetrahydrofolate reductase(NADPH)
MTLRERLATEVLVCDGAMGTMLHAAGNSLDQALPALNLSDPALVRTIHDSYVEAGVRIIQTNTFGASRLRLAEYGFGDRVAEINEAAVRIARDATGSVNRDMLVAGSVSPAVSVQQRRRVSRSERVAALREQIDILTAAGVDLVVLETFGYLDELVEAVQAAGELCEVPVIAQATFGGDARTLSGHSPREVTDALAGAPIVALGTNCTLGPQRSLAVLRELGEHSDLPLTVQPNAGLPRRTAPARFEYDIDSEYFVRYIRALLDAGASIVGGCCGTTPTQLAAVVAAVDEHRRRAAATGAAAVGPRITVADQGGATGATAFPRPGQVVFELAPETADSVDQTLALAGEIRDLGIRLVSVAASSGTRARLNAVDLALHLQQRLDIDTLATVSTWDRTIMALQADLLGAHALGVRRIVCETGRPPLLGDYPHVDGVWDVESLGLIEMLAGLNEGTDYHGLPVPTKTAFEIGARINPGGRDTDRAARRARDKIAAGAQFLITRPVYELDGLRRLLDAVDGRVPVLVALRPLASFEEADYLLHEVPDVSIPASTLAALEGAGHRAGHVGVELAAELAHEVRDMTSGIVVSAGAAPLWTVQWLISRAGLAPQPPARRG